MLVTDTQVVLRDTAVNLLVHRGQTLETRWLGISA
jgi:hypothetical protein